MPLQLLPPPAFSRFIRISPPRLRQAPEQAPHAWAYRDSEVRASETSGAIAGRSGGGRPGGGHPGGGGRPLRPPTRPQGYPHGRGSGPRPGYPTYYPYPVPYPYLSWGEVDPYALDLDPDTYTLLITSGMSSGHPTGHAERVGCLPSLLSEMEAYGAYGNRDFAFHPPTRWRER